MGIRGLIQIRILGRILDKFPELQNNGIEIEDGTIRLIKWSAENQQRLELEKEQLVKIFDHIRS